MKAITIGQFIKRENNNLDLIRILCAYFVIYAHAFVLSPAEGSNDILYKITLLGHVSFGGLAVKTFFLISGLLVTHSLLTNGRIINYIGSRFLRVFPAYAVTVVVSALIIGPWLSTLSLSDYFSSNEVWSYVVKTLKFDVQYTLPGVFSGNATNAVNGSLWTIPLEVKAYSYLLLIYLASLAFGPYKKLFIAFISIVILVEPFTPLKGHLIAKSDSPTLYLLYPFFAIGCLLAILKDRVTTRGLLATAVIALLAFFIIDDENGKTALFYVFASLLLLYCASTSYLKRLKIKNDISYGIYLWAFPIQQVIASVLVASPYTNIVLSMIVSSMFAYLSFKWVESPAMTINKRLQRNHASLQSDRV
ncbi:acyltransferase [Serratia nevei]|uniref:acyltransferase family protein n=1 Tax=Serratia nevei TaxID=2703794 RepID=UPI0020A0E1EE|nr:acyltransferase [Serratia nevei]MCP1103856.1 acyltransferase [Serratia nevei]